MAGTNRAFNPNSMSSREFRAVAIGASAGGFDAISNILSALPADFDLPVLVVQHLHPSDNGSFYQLLAGKTTLRVLEPCDKYRIKPAAVYIAPANYHMLIERDETVALSVDEKVNFSRPSIDVLFETAARTWGKRLIAVILSGASSDGAQGMCAVREAGGMTVAQSPESAECPFMPQAAIDAAGIKTALTPLEIGETLRDLRSPQQGDDCSRNRSVSMTGSEKEDV